MDEKKEEKTFLVAGHKKVFSLSQLHNILKTIGSIVCKLGKLYSLEKKVEIPATMAASNSHAITFSPYYVRIFIWWWS